ncbi:MAG: alpha/beta hydrolase [Rhizobiales bacterium]|nr:alpha/beta hydrolase [Hyphomicrobiales bacterium]
MPEVIINGPAGRIEARYHHNPNSDSPIAVILHPHPQFGGTMNNPIVYQLYYTFVNRGFSVLRFNFRGVGRSQGLFDNGPGELSDAAAALDWVQGFNPEAPFCWIAGVSFGSWIAMQLLMRRPEIHGFVTVAAQPDLYDFTFLAPCPASGLMISGEYDRVAPTSAINDMLAKVKTQKGIKIEHTVIPSANHFFEEQMTELMRIANTYLDMRLTTPPRPARIAAPIEDAVDEEPLEEVMDDGEDD